MCSDPITPSSKIQSVRKRFHNGCSNFDANSKTPIYQSKMMQKATDKPTILQKRIANCNIA